MTTDSRPPNRKNLKTIPDMINEEKGIIRDNDRPPDWAVARAFWEYIDTHILVHSVADIKSRAREIAEEAE